ncbi:hypothetical protein [Thalassotalea crassostreae]|uniref:hypothetical protein n=1 Tax=Thalassotalea crassostreae TaxID=1763536 RepID=UPI0008383418|nr:hypothetical protein [Thalassotalea crassostreae]
MMIVISILGALIVFAGVLLVIKPLIIIGYLKSHKDSLWLYLSAIIVRVIVGYLLIVFAKHSIYPAAITVIGWIAVVAALAFLVMGRAKFTLLLTWLINSAMGYARLMGILAIIFGSFILYAFT